MTAGRSDYLIVGAGAAGCAPADPLSACERRKATLLETGGDGGGVFIPIPGGVSKPLVGERFNRRFWSTPEAAARNRRIAIPRGEGLGGSTLINGMVRARGQRQECDGWAQAGCQGRGFDDVPPSFAKIEPCDGAGGAERGREGPSPLTEVKERPEIAQAFIAAGRAMGLPACADAYRKPARRRPNLKVVTGAFVARILIENGRARGVEARVGAALRRFDRDGSNVRASAIRRV